jgi:hypothetical protein
MALPIVYIGAAGDGGRKARLGRAECRMSALRRESPGLERRGIVGNDSECGCVSVTLEPSTREVDGMSDSKAGAAKRGGAMYGLGMFGALVYCWHLADSFWEYRLSIFQGIFWLLLCSTRCLKPLTD